MQFERTKIRLSSKQSTIHIYTQGTRKAECRISLKQRKNLTNLPKKLSKKNIDKNHKIKYYKIIQKNLIQLWSTKIKRERERGKNNNNVTIGQKKLSEVNNNSMHKKFGYLWFDYS